MLEEWMLPAAYSVASLLPAEHNDALAVLALVKQIVLKINKPYVGRLRGALVEEDLRDLVGRRGNGRVAAAASLSETGGRPDRLPGRQPGSSSRRGAADKAAAASPLRKKSRLPR